MLLLNFPRNRLLAGQNTSLLTLRFPPNPLHKLAARPLPKQTWQVISLSLNVTLRRRRTAQAQSLFGVHIVALRVHLPDPVAWNSTLVNIWVGQAPPAPIEERARANIPPDRVGKPAMKVSLLVSKLKPKLLNREGTLPPFLPIMVDPMANFAPKERTLTIIGLLAPVAP